MVPRWRSTAVTGHLPELRSSLRNRPGKDNGIHEFNEALAGWEAGPTASSAVEVISAALVTDQGQKALDAARFLVDDGNAAVYALRKSVSSSLLGAFLPAEVPQPSSHTLVHDLRARSLAYPRNPLAWIDLALAYTNLGQVKRAERFIKMAMSLCPNNRFVLRSAVRYYLHSGEGDRAYDLLDASPMVDSDPWLSAAKLAAACIISRRPDNLKGARSLLQSKDYSAYDTSELASQLATIDLQDGHRLRSKKLFEHALKSPTDNSLAQVRWIEDLDTSFSIPPGAASAARDFEANALKHFHNGAWHDSVADSWKWHRDEPFARRSSILGSYISCELLQDYDQACNFARAGLASNPGDSSLLNNMAYSFAMLGKIEEAKQCLSEIRPRRYENITLIPRLATSGAICFREGNILEGRKWYLEAIEESRGPDLAKVRVMAMIHLALEEVRGNSMEAMKWTKLALEAADESTSPDIIVLRTRLRDAFLEMQALS